MKFMIFINTKGCKIFYYLSIIINIGLVGILYASLSNSDIDFLFNADELFFSSFYNDFVNNKSFDGWLIPGAPNLVPDMVLYFFLSFIFSGNIFFTFISFSIIQVFLIIFLINYIFKLIVPDNYFPIATLSNLLFSGFFISGIISKDLFIPFHLISVSYHTGAFIMTLISLIFSLKYILQPSKWSVYFLIITIILASFSDLLFIIIFTIPFIFTIFLAYRQNKRTCSYLLSVIIVSSFVGVLLVKFLSFVGVSIAGNYHLLELSKLKLSVTVFINQFIDLLFNVNVFSLIFLLSIIAFLIVRNFLYRQYYQKILYFSNQTTINYLMVYFFISVYIIIFTPLINGNYIDNSSIRYIMPVFYFCTFLLPLIVYFQFSKKDLVIKIYKYLSIIMVIIIIGFNFSFVKNNSFINNLRNIKHYYPLSAKLADSLYNQSNFNYGISTYWNAKPASIFSKNKINVLAIYSDEIKPYIHASNKNWYFSADNKTKIFNFFMTNKDFNTQIIEKRLGKPMNTLIMGDLTAYVFSPFKFDKVTHEPYFVDSNYNTPILEQYFLSCDSFKNWSNEKYEFSQEQYYSGHFSDKISKSNRFGTTFNIKWMSFITVKPTKIRITANVYSKSKNPDAHIVVHILDGENSIFWSSIRLHEIMSEKMKWKQVRATIALPVDFISANSNILVYSWVIDNSVLYFDNYKIEFLK